MLSQESSYGMVFKICLIRHIFRFIVWSLLKPERIAQKATILISMIYCQFLLNVLHQIVCIV